MPKFSTDAILEEFLTQLEGLPTKGRIDHIMAMTKPQLERALLGAVLELLAPTVEREI